MRVISILAHRVIRIKEVTLVKAVERSLAQPVLWRCALLLCTGASPNVSTRASHIVSVCVDSGDLTDQLKNVRLGVKQTRFSPGSTTTHL